MTDLTHDAIMAELRSRMENNAPAATGATEAPKPVPSGLFAAAAAVEIPKDKVEYKDIIGEEHPSGNSYYFTVYEDSDWDTEIAKLIPVANDTHVFDHDYALSILMSIEYDKPLFAYGPPGSGKSVTPEQICARIHYPYMFVAGMGGTEPSDYVGSPWVSEGSMEWKDGPMSFAVRHGVFLLYDEPFKSSAQTNMCMQSLLDDRRTLKLYGHPDPIQGNLKAHPKFRMILADNVRGCGDQMDKYAAEVQDQSTLNRAAYKVQVNYMSPSREVRILQKKFPSLTDKLANKIVGLAGLLRGAWEEGTIELPYSIRDTQEFAHAALIHQSAAAAFKQTYFNSVKDTTERNHIIDMWNHTKFEEEQLS